MGFHQQASPDRYVPLLVEEVLRLESPVQGLFRSAAVDVAPSNTST